MGGAEGRAVDGAVGGLSEETSYPPVQSAAARQLAAIVTASPDVRNAQITIRHVHLTINSDGWQALWAGRGAAQLHMFGILRTLAVMPSKVSSRDVITNPLHERDDRRDPAGG